MNINPKYFEIVEREFRKAAKLPPVVDVSVQFTDDEDIIVTVNNEEWRMSVGSDDDYFWFHAPNGEDVVSFDYPPDWIELEEEENSKIGKEYK